MDDLIEALAIIRKYTGNVRFPTNCQHDVLTVCVKDKAMKKVTPEDLKRLDKLGFFPGDEGGFESFRFGSC